MKKHIIFIVCILLVFGALAGCKNSNKKDEISFTATVLENNESQLLIEPEAGSSELGSADKISVSISDATLVDNKDKGITVDGIKVGDKVEIYYNGQIAESYPAQIHNCYKIVVLD